ncbi:pyruvate formate lyase family protein [uncultured Tolumonas sp.]|uniref:pyruvate formate lyase family protein n=1 Tax=uncultured Tolumonas sp. TaxID=263765 RepID=UPI00374A11B6
MKTTYEVSNNAWTGFAEGTWQSEVDVRAFIQKNYTPYEGDESFLAGPSTSTLKLWDQVLLGIQEENRTHAPIDFDTDLPSTITSHGAGYIDQTLEKIVGLQTDAPLKRGIIANGGIRMVKTSCEVYGRKLGPVDLC